MRELTPCHPRIQLPAESSSEAMLTRAMTTPPRSSPTTNVAIGMSQNRRPLSAEELHPAPDSSGEGGWSDDGVDILPSLKIGNSHKLYAIAMACDTQVECALLQ